MTQWARHSLQIHASVCHMDDSLDRWQMLPKYNNGNDNHSMLHVQQLASGPPSRADLTCMEIITVMDFIKMASFQAFFSISRFPRYADANFVVSVWPCAVCDDVVKLATNVWFRSCKCTWNPVCLGWRMRVEVLDHTWLFFLFPAFSRNRKNLDNISNHFKLKVHQHNLLSQKYCWRQSI